MLAVDQQRVTSFWQRQLLEHEYDQQQRGRGEADAAPRACCAYSRQGAGAGGAGGVQGQPLACGRAAHRETPASLRTTDAGRSSPPPAGLNHSRSHTRASRVSCFVSIKQPMPRRGSGPSPQRCPTSCACCGRHRSRCAWRAAAPSASSPRWTACTRLGWIPRPTSALPWTWTAWGLPWSGCSYATASCWASQTSASQGLREPQVVPGRWVMLGAVLPQE